MSPRRRSPCVAACVVLKCCCAGVVVSGERCAFYHPHIAYFMESTASNESYEDALHVLVSSTLREKRSCEHLMRVAA